MNDAKTKPEDERGVSELRGTEMTVSEIKVTEIRGRVIGGSQIKPGASDMKWRILIAVVVLGMLVAIVIQQAY